MKDNSVLTGFRLRHLAPLAVIAFPLLTQSGCPAPARSHGSRLQLHKQRA